MFSRKVVMPLVMPRVLIKIELISSKHWLIGQSCVVKVIDNNTSIVLEQDSGLF